MRRVRGLTLVELMITIAVLAVLVTLAVPSFDDALARRRVEGSAEVLRADLDLARSEAVQRHEAVTVSFGPNCYVLHLASATATCTAASATVLPADALIRTVLPDSDRVVLAAQDDLTAIRFDATMGTADFAGPALAPAGGTIDVTATGRPAALRVVIQRNRPLDVVRARRQRHRRARTVHPLRRPAFRAGARSQRGLSLTEMMVGLTVGLFITGAALMAAVNATGENRRLLLEARLLQDLRATMDLVTRSLRRAGYWGNAQAGVRAVGDAAAQSGYEATGYAVVTLASDSATTVQFRVASDADDSADDDETLGFRLATGSDAIGRVQVLLAGAAAYQDLTDPAVTHVTEFTVEALPQAAVALTCPSACGMSPLPACPTLQVRQYRITMRAQAVSDAAVRRGLQSTVRLRNDLLSGACP